MVYIFGMSNTKHSAILKEMRNKVYWLHSIFWFGDDRIVFSWLLIIWLLLLLFFSWLDVQSHNKYIRLLEWKPNNIILEPFIDRSIIFKITNILHQTISIHKNKKQIISKIPHIIWCFYWISTGYSQLNTFTNNPR